MTFRGLLPVLALSLACGGSPPPTAAAVEVAAPVQAAAPYTGPAPDGIYRLRIPVNGQPQLGPDDAAVTVVVFSDFQCPFCGRVVGTLNALRARYGDELRIVWRNLPLPFHQNAPAAARLAMEAHRSGGDDMFWRLHDVLFENQRELDAPSLRRYAASVGMSGPSIERALEGAHQEVLEADSSLATQIGARGTPNFFINGEQLTGAQPLEQFVDVIERAKTAANFLRSRGVPSYGIYEALMVNANDEPDAQPDRVAARPARRQPDPAAIYSLPITGMVPTRGPADALVTIVEFSDFECPFCSRVEPTLREIINRYGNDVRIAWMNNPLPFHSNAEPAAIAALEAFDQGGNAMFWAYHQKLFENQRSLTRENLERFGTEVGMNLSALRAALDGRSHIGEIQRQQALAQARGASGTPSFFINGRNVRGAQPLAAFAAVIDEELTRARAAVAAGTARGPALYEALTGNGATSAQFLPDDAPEPPRPGALPEDHDYAIAAPSNAPTRGSANGQIQVQIFSDFQCPFCGRVRPTLDTLVQEYGNRVQFIWRDYPLPFHTNAHLAAEAAREVFAQRGNEAFWQYHDLLFSNQRNLERADLVGYARQIQGLDLARFEQALDNRTHGSDVDADIEAVRAAGARIGTPSFFVNGRLIQGAQPVQAFRDIINRELAR